MTVPEMTVRTGPKTATKDWDELKKERLRVKLQNTKRWKQRLQVKLQKTSMAAMFSSQKESILRYYIWAKVWQHKSCTNDWEGIAFLISPKHEPQKLHNILQLVRIAERLKLAKVVFQMDILPPWSGLLTYSTSSSLEKNYQLRVDRLQLGVK